AEALQEADRLKSEFIANVSFEVRTPLTTIIGFSELLADEQFGAFNPRQMEYANGIHDSATTLMAVISDILDLAMIEAGMMRLELDAVDIHAMLVGVLGLVRERARHKSLKLEFDCPTEVGWIIADAKRLKQAIFNLVSNAVTFTPPRGAIRLSAVREEPDVVIRVADSGPGIAAADLARVFQPFAQATAGTTSPGAGLGLSLVKQFVELHGGRVRLDSAPKRGLSVSLFLPALGPADDDAEA
ncbi:MAG: HAMP domain-containing sensor histidine kinase, partial [Rhodospirillales bacterium]|nr:HAMP domain-containing sensor histidine kinase [Rhodospirillales bacterium]